MNCNNFDLYDYLLLFNLMSVSSWAKSKSDARGSTNTHRNARIEC